MPADITAYENTYGLPNVPLQNILLDGSRGGGERRGRSDTGHRADDCPGARRAKILVYEGTNSGQGVIDTYSRIATDNTAKEVSTSWGSPENNSDPKVI